MYDTCSPGYRGRCTAPLLVDRRARRIVSNESAGIVRNLNAVSLAGCTDVDLVPPTLAAEIDALNEQIYDKVPTAACVKLHVEDGGWTSGLHCTPFTQQCHPALMAFCADGIRHRRCTSVLVQVNNGVYKSGFATTQGAYDRAQRELYTALDMLERRLQNQDFLVGNRYH